MHARTYLFRVHSQNPSLMSALAILVPAIVPPVLHFINLSGLSSPSAQSVWSTCYSDADADAEAWSRRSNTICCPVLLPVPHGRDDADAV